MPVAPPAWLVLRVDQRLGPGPNLDPGRLQFVQVLGRDVLVVERHHIAALGERQQRSQIVVSADPDVADHLSRRFRRTGGQHSQPDPEGDRGLGHHPRELPTTDNPDHREPWRARCPHGFS
jgi:hypothetical protein